jgi:hypothetical protein
MTYMQRIWEVMVYVHSNTHQLHRGRALNCTIMVESCSNDHSTDTSNVVSILTTITIQPQHDTSTP